MVEPKPTWGDWSSPLSEVDEHAILTVIGPTCAFEKEVAVSRRIRVGSFVDNTVGLYYSRGRRCQGFEARWGGYVDEEGRGGIRQNLSSREGGRYGMLVRQERGIPSTLLPNF